MRTFRLVLAAVAAASALGAATPASAQHQCIQLDESMRPICLLPHYCVWYEDGTIRCWY